MPVARRRVSEPRRSTDEGSLLPEIVYTTIIEDLLNGPPMMSPRGRWLWSFLVIGYWGLAFVIGTAIPSIGALSGLVAAVAIFQFTYTFPPLLMVSPISSGVRPTSPDASIASARIRRRMGRLSRRRAVQHSWRHAEADRHVEFGQSMEARFP